MLTRLHKRAKHADNHPTRQHLFDAAAEQAREIGSDDIDVDRVLREFEKVHRHFPRFITSALQWKKYERESAPSCAGCRTLNAAGRAPAVLARCRSPLHMRPCDFKQSR